MKGFKLIATEPDGQNPRWSYYNAKGAQTIPVMRLFQKDSKIFTLGSCFAVEIRRALKSRNVTVYPNWGALDFDKQKALVGDFPERENFNFYNTFSIEQELAKARGLWRQEADDFWTVQDAWWNTDEPAYQDPYRRCVFGKNLDEIVSITQQIDGLVKAGVENADGFLITLGLIEVWRKRNNNKVACMHPGYNQGGGKEELQFHLSSYDENRENLEQIVSHIHAINPQANIVFTVSPVPLGMTFTSTDVVVANLESKSLLRAAAAEVCRKHEKVHYFQSYDICSSLGNVFEDDGRHVRPGVVKMITDAFMASYFTS